MTFTFRPRSDSITRAAYGCMECGEVRVYGFSADPDPALIMCGRCKKHTVHEFVKLVHGWVGRPCPLAPRAS